MTTPPPPEGYPPYPYPNQGMQPVPQSKSFFGALFDFSFAFFITPKIVKLVYVLSLIGIVLVWLFWLVAGFQVAPAVGVVVLIFGPVIGLIELAFVRMTLEFYMSIVRMSEDIHHRLPR